MNGAPRMNRTCLVVQHLEVEGPFEIAEAIRSAGVDTQWARVYAGDLVPPDSSGLDALVVMGGPMSARSDEGFASRRAEIRLLRDAVERGIPVLGVCLGAQLLAAAAGGEVLSGPAGPEIGWGFVALTEHAKQDALLAGLPEQIPVLHWHSETFEIPPSGVRLAGSSKYPNQAFRVGECAWGLQFHLEVDATAVASFTVAFDGEALDAGCDPAVIRNETASVLDALTPHRDLLLARFAALAAAYHQQVRPFT